MADSFWAGGPEAYAKALRAKYQPRLADLRKRRKQLAGSERAKLDAEIERIESEYQSELDAIDDCHF